MLNPITTYLWRMAPRLGATVRRFPLPLGAAAMATLFFLSINNDWELFGALRSEEISYFESLFLAFFYLLAVALAAERYVLSKPVHAVVAAVGLGFLVWRIILSPGPDLNYGDFGIVFLGPAFLLAVMAVSNFHGRGSAAFWTFNQRALVGAGFAFLATGTVAVGIVAAFWAIETLLGIDIPGSLYDAVWQLSLCLIWPWLALSRVPAEIETGDAGTPWGIRFITTYILVPLALVYMAIVYAYIGKILVQGSLPQGEIASVITPLALFIVATHLIAFPLAGGGALVTRFFCRHAYRLLLPPIALLIFAIWIRVDAHGLTEPRYALIAVAIWLAAMALYFSLRPGGRLVVVPATLSVMLFLGSFGPWGADDLSTWNQLGRLKATLEANDMLVDGRAQKQEKGIIDGRDADRIYGALLYFEESGKLDRIKSLLASDPLDSSKRPSSAEEYMAKLGMPIDTYILEDRRFAFRAPFQTGTDISDFDFLMVLDLDERNMDEPTVLTVRHPGLSDAITITITPALVKVVSADGDTVVFDLAGEVTRLRQEGRAEDSLGPMDGSDGALRVRLIPESLYGFYSDHGPRVDYGSATVLIGWR